MSDVLDTIVVKFGEDSDGGTPDATIILDDLLNKDSEGEVKTSFTADDTVYLLVHLHPSLHITRITYTSGEVTSLGQVSRNKTEEQVFFPDSDKNTLSLYPSSGISSEFYGRECSFTVNEKDVVSLSPPVIADLSYTFNAYSLEMIPPSGLNLGEDDSWPIGVVVWVSE